MIRALGKLAISIAILGFLSAVSLLLLGSFLMTWPIMRKSPRDAKIQATVEMASAVMGAIQVYARKGAE